MHGVDGMMIAGSIGIGGIVGRFIGHIRTGGI